MTRSVLALPLPLAMDTWAEKRPAVWAAGRTAMRYFPMVMGAEEAE